MKFATRMKVLAGAIALVAAGHANAAVIGNAASTGNSDFLFSAYDSLGKSYVLGLNFRMDDMLAAPTTTKTFDLTGLASFFAGSPDAVWSVTAADAVGSQFKNFRIVTTFDVTNTGGPTSTLNSGVKGAASGTSSGFTAFVNQAGGTAYVPLTSTNTTDLSYAGQALWGNNWGSNGPSDTAPLANGSVLASWLLNTANGTQGIGHPALTQLSNWKLDFTHDKLVYAPAAVPVPATVWLLSSGLAGVASMKRRRKV